MAIRITMKDSMMPTTTGGRPRSAFSYLTASPVRTLRPSEAVGYPAATRATVRPKATTSRPSTPPLPTRAATSASFTGRFSHLLRRPSGPGEEADARTTRDPDALLARRILAAHAEVEGRAPPEHVQDYPRRRTPERATSAAIIIADLKRRGLM